VTLLLALLLHGDSVSSSTIEVSGREVRVTFTLSMADLAELARLDPDRNGVVDPAEWARVLPSIHSYLSSRFRIEGCRGEGEPAPVPPTLRVPVALRMRYVSSGPVERLKLACDLFREHEGNVRHVAELPGGRIAVFDREQREADVPVAPSGFPWHWAAAAVGALAALPGFVRLAGAASA
jgi:hypothetical protein